MCDVRNREKWSSIEAHLTRGGTVMGSPRSVIMVSQANGTSLRSNEPTGAEANAKIDGFLCCTTTLIVSTVDEVALQLC